jgi:hypothetical protein
MTRCQTSGRGKTLNVDGSSGDESGARGWVYRDCLKVSESDEGMTLLCRRGKWDGRHSDVLRSRTTSTTADSIASNGEAAIQSSSTRVFQVSPSCFLLRRAALTNRQPSKLFEATFPVRLVS